MTNWIKKALTTVGIPDKVPQRAADPGAWAERFFAGAHPDDLPEVARVLLRMIRKNAEAKS